MKWLKRAFLALLTVALVAALVWAFLPQPVVVDVALVTFGRFEQAIEEDGKTRVRERYTVSAPLAGKVKRIALKAGDEVTLDAVLATIEPGMPSLLDVRTERELSERLGAAEAAKLRAAAVVDRAQATLEKARADLERTRKLAASGFVSPAQFEQAELSFKVNTRELEVAKQADHAAEHDVAVARAALMRVRQASSTNPSGRQTPNHNPAGRNWEVRSPVAGRVLRVLQESEAIVGVGTPLLEIGDPADLEVVVDVLSSDAVQIQQGAKVRIERWGRTEPLLGRVRRVEPSAFTKISALGVEEQRVNVIIDPISPVELWQTLGDGYRIDARIVVFESENAIKVPVGALFREGDRWTVFAVSGNRAQRRVVQLERHGTLEVAVSDGIKPGEQVIVYPGDAVRDGAGVKAR
ncbi:MAG TPA: HlyD family efflux transporter periplasmic adaptor subunit [Burkholderiales bacterium]|nr:HlyD family efflux transporter periplasmic adaptor subunit [Burkholderiales bacterium]